MLSNPVEQDVSRNHLYYEKLITLENLLKVMLGNPWRSAGGTTTAVKLELGIRAMDAKTNSVLLIYLLPCLRKFRLPCDHGSSPAGHDQARMKMLSGQALWILNANYNIRAPY